MVFWQEEKGIQQNKLELCTVSQSAFQLACTEVIQDEVRWMLKSVENQEETQQQHVCGQPRLASSVWTQGLVTNVCVVFRISSAGIFQGTICFISCRFRLGPQCRQYPTSSEFGLSNEPGAAARCVPQSNLVRGPERRRYRAEVPLLPSGQAAVPAPSSSERLRVWFAFQCVNT